MNTAMRLHDLLAGYAAPNAHGEIVVRGLAIDSRQVQHGDAFFALQGGSDHGIRFADTAIRAGAAAIIAESCPDMDAGSVREPVIWIDDLSQHLGPIAARFFGDASRTLQVTGVTGTNGKTSTVQLLAQSLNHLGRRTATIGTLGAGLPESFSSGERTTPDAIQIQRLLVSFLDQGATDVAMEVSSHALEQGRVNGIHFRVAVFTNLTRDHLDYHGNMEAYAAAKQKLFAMPALTVAVINTDDSFGRTLAANLPAEMACISYGMQESSAAVNAQDIETHAGGLRFLLRTPWGQGQVESSLLGRFNVANLLAVAASLGAMGYGFADIARALATLEPVDGRMSRLGGSATQPLVVIDYAHTPDALEQALVSLRQHCEGQLICVFGCGGERDVGKRPQMAAIAERLADRVIVTDDNPRAEDGDAIVAAIMQGFENPVGVAIQRDRGCAIHAAIHAARPDDIVLVAGKGHEPYQEVRGERLVFDDRDVARQALEARS
ncbi:UDP-N-acetylmuramoyl-L-alanyl-D-glutamate--2,6-diaminopimelate ligase [Dokdonella sp.]|uniref:UDP-N-acetylmuramoyl-L-alanyl-D-glutamate--2, 6-diaminopimelate ligase n=1 Tax=Dokdonella sp. TaxID=2291710 RepID=UPI003C4B61DE